MITVQKSLETEVKIESGNVKPSNDTVQGIPGSDDTVKGIPDSDESVKGIPDFWLTVLHNADFLSSLIQVCPSFLAWPLS